MSKHIGCTRLPRAQKSAPRAHRMDHQKHIQMICPGISVVLRPDLSGQGDGGGVAAIAARARKVVERLAKVGPGGEVVIPVHGAFRACLGGDKPTAVGSGPGCGPARQRASREVPDSEPGSSPYICCVGESKFVCVVR